MDYTGDHRTSLSFVGPTIYLYVNKLSLLLSRVPCTVTGTSNRTPGTEHGDGLQVEDGVVVDHTG